MVGSICTQETRKDSKKVKSKYWSVSQIRIRTPEKCRPCVSDRQENGNGFLDEGDRKRDSERFPAFEFIEDDDTKVPPGYEFVDTYFVFDIKMDLTRKARLVARGNMTEATKEQTFASVVSRDAVRLFFLLALSTI
ncbi:hypothetical protein MHU86_2782 [Fragilaria crotonensis]|nr:hypothetical protein MHU86_2782 [Fragilaria crotonensis]